MSQYFIETEYDLDLVTAETIKLIKLNHTTVNIGFHNKKMVKIFLDNLNATLEEQQVEKNKKVNINISVIT
jgi:hypothetical protein